jgi:uncharacterized protein (TIGR03118 family)
MRKIHSAIATLSVALLLGGAGPAAAQFYTQHNLVSDIPGLADLTDSSLVNAWGLVSSTSSPWWVSNNGTATSTLYNGNNGAKVALTNLPCQCVIVPGAPTGVVFNGTPFATGTGFVVTSGGASGPARFIFASEDGSISGWNPGVSPRSRHRSCRARRSSRCNPPMLPYKGLAIASTIPGNVAGDLLYATNFHAGTVDVFDHTFAPVHTHGAFTDASIPKGYAPFGIRNIGGIIYVTYALQDADAHDDVPGMGHGFVNAFDTGGHLLRHVATRGTLNSPWDSRFHRPIRKFSNDPLSGNSGNGRIHAYDPGDTLGNGEFKTAACCAQCGRRAARDRRSMGAVLLRQCARRPVRCTRSSSLRARTANPTVCSARSFLRRRLARNLTRINRQGAPRYTDLERSNAPADHAPRRRA